MSVAFESYLLIYLTIPFLIVYAVLLNIYFVYKNGFHVRVNCWFCNKNSKVLYSNRNSFECPFCFQYNGFNKDGGYNKIIEAQRNTSLNILKIFSKIRTEPSISKLSNGLCDSCNRNQELKVIQLANYEALDDRNYDKEVVHFEKQLEKTYGLCKTCSKIVKNTLRRQSAWIFGKRIKSLKNLKLNKHKSNIATQGSHGAKFYHRLSIFRLFLFALSLFNLIVVCGLHEFLPKDILPTSLLPSDVMISDVYSAVYNFSVRNFGSKSFMVYLPKTIKLQRSSVLHLSICVLGLFFELLFSFFEPKCGIFVKFNKLFSWIVLELVSSVPFKQDISLYVRTLEIFCSLYLTYVYSSNIIESKNNHTEKFHLKRIKRDNNYSDNGETDSDSLNNSRLSYRTAVNKHSPITASSFNNFNKSFESVRSTKSILNNIRHSDLPTPKNVELNKHFNELNIGAFDSSNICKDYHSPASPNPFLNQTTRPQSPSGLYNYGSTYNSPSGTFLNQSQHGSFFTSQHNRLHSSLNNVTKLSRNCNTDPQFLEQARVSPMSVRTDRVYSPDQFNNLTRNPYNEEILTQPSTSSLLKNNHSHIFCPRDTSSVISQSIPTPRSPVYNLKSNRLNMSSPIPTNEETLNSSFRPLSPTATLERPSRSLLSPPKLNNINSFHSDAKGNGSLSMSFYTDNIPNTGIWPNLNSSHLHQRFVVNSLSNIMCNSPLNSTFVPGNIDIVKPSNSRSSSTSSGFISNGDFNKGLSKSLPNSRDNSPKRSSLFSEPVYA